ncbi:hypothetical protein L6164_015628 [Bauhinia variegata]|uniref:Uncharacterized protein n=1 Tax=Bauhinia variegata TaxID=167791 RepID=A0ACB9NMH1_BAUVA|nr:hypothetical protein L6164_015628 [Bauhinia variegata]
MQSRYELGIAQYHELMDDDCCSSILPISGPRTNQNCHLLQQHYLHQHQLLLQQRKQQLCHYTYEQVHLLPNNHQYQSFLQEEKVAGLLGGNEYRICQGPPHSVDLPQCGQPQQESSAKISLWRTFNSEGKHQRGNGNEKCIASENKYRPLSELEAVYRLALPKETNQRGQVSALTAENSHTNGTLPLMPLVDPNASATATDHVSEASVGEEASMRRARKRMRRKTMEEDLSSIAVFFESLVKRVISYQEGLHDKFMEVIERMDKDQEEREEAWRRQEIENYNREAIVRARERALACSRDSSIVSYIERLTGQSLNLASIQSTRDHNQRMENTTTKLT